ncbi:MAG: sulfatase/phosphatase domain-containing protein [Planctomycetota bacterium]
MAAWPRDPEVIRDQIAEYYGLISHLDAEIGRIFTSLEESGMAENTLVIFAADHGLAMGSHGLLGKQNLYEHSMGAPLVLSGPGIPKGGRSQALVYLLDLFPTICEISAAGLPEGVDGSSLLPLIRGESEAWRSSLFTLYRDNQRALRDERYKLIRFTKTNKTLFFDLSQDPQELEDLADRPEHAEKVASMLASMAAWQSRCGDDQALNSETPLPETIDLSNRARKPDRHQPDWIRRKYFDSSGGKKP